MYGKFKDSPEWRTKWRNDEKTKKKNKKRYPACNTYPKRPNGNDCRRDKCEPRQQACSFGGLPNEPQYLDETMSGKYGWMKTPYVVFFCVCLARAFLLVWKPDSPNVVPDRSPTTRISTEPKTSLARYRQQRGSSVRRRWGVVDKGWISSMRSELRFSGNINEEEKERCPLRSCWRRWPKEKEVMHNRHCTGCMRLAG